MVLLDAVLRRNLHQRWCIYYIFTREAAVARNQFCHSLVGTFQPINTVTEYHARHV